MSLTDSELNGYKALLESKRQEILENARNTLAEEMSLDVSDLPVEMDLASSEYLQSFSLRMRGREKFLLEKVELALEKIAAKTFGLCEECGDEISPKRL